MADESTTVTIALGERAYPVHIGPGELARLGERMAARGLAGRTLVVTNPQVEPLYGEAALAALAGAGVAAQVVVIPAGERSKTLATTARIWSAAMAHKLDRGSVIVALGGGIVGDVAGFAAACYYRGVRLVQVPTTLVAMVDSSVGGKTGVNFEGKNLVGAFWQPSLVVADLAALATLPPRELRCGLAEVIKHGAILDHELFERLERDFVGAPRAACAGFRLGIGPRLSLDMARLAVQRSCELKGAVVAEDEREAGKRAWLNFGHTFGHALEAVGGLGRLHHGEAVAIGMMLAARLGVRRGDLPASVEARLGAVLRAVGLPTGLPSGTDPDEVLALMYRDKKVRDGRLTLTLLRRLGEAMVVSDTPPALVREVLAEGAT